jgi:hypothetical protein
MTCWCGLTSACSRRRLVSTRAAAAEAGRYARKINHEGDNHEHGEAKRDDDERQLSGSIDVRSKDDEL